MTWRAPGDGRHLLASGAIVVVEGGLPVAVHVGLDADTLALSDDVERLTRVWIDTIDDERDEDESDLPIALEVLDAQPTHIFTDERDGARLVCIREEFGKMWALRRVCFEEGEDYEWSPYLRDGVWFDSWDDKALPGARVEPLATEPQA